MTWAWWVFLLLLAVLQIPFLEYCRLGFRIRREAIMNYLSGEAGSNDPHASFERYYKQFFRKEVTADMTDFRAAFLGKYNERFGRRTYLIPFAGFLLTAAAILFLVVSTVAGWLGDAQMVSTVKWKLPAQAVAAIAGGYMWVLNDLIGRVRRLDLRPADVNWSTFRLIISVPMGFALAPFSAEGFELAVAFFAGSFPTTSLLTIFRRLGSRQLKLGDSAENPTSQLEKLQTVTTATAERFADEGTTAVPQLAYIDPVDASIRTGFTFNYVVDCVSEALAWIYLEDRLATARKFGLRGAQEIWTLINELDTGTQHEQDLARQTLDELATALGLSPNVVERTFREIHGDPYTVFIQEIWC